MLVKSHCTTSAEMRWMWRLVPIQVSIHGASSTTCRSLSIAKYNGHTTIPATPAAMFCARGKDEIMTRPPTEAASISLELKDDAKQGRVSGIASPGRRSVPLSFCVPPIQHTAAISLPSGSTQPCSPGRAQIWPFADSRRRVSEIHQSDLSRS